MHLQIFLLDVFGFSRSMNSDRPPNSAQVVVFTSTCIRIPRTSPWVTHATVMNVFQGSYSRNGCRPCSVGPWRTFKQVYKSRHHLTYDRFRMIDRMVTLPPALQERLTVEDDPALWEQVLKTLAGDASTIKPVKHGSPLYAEVGVCSHWLRPHQSRWTAAGGFAYPTGYGDAGLHARRDRGLLPRVRSARYAAALEAKGYLKREARIGSTNSFNLTPLFAALNDAVGKERKIA